MLLLINTCLVINSIGVYRLLLSFTSRFSVVLSSFSKSHSYSILLIYFRAKFVSYLTIVFLPFLLTCYKCWFYFTKLFSFPLHVCQICLVSLWFSFSLSVLLSIFFFLFLFQNVVFLFLLFVSVLYFLYSFPFPKDYLFSSTELCSHFSSCFLFLQ